MKIAFAAVAAIVAVWLIVSVFGHFLLLGAGGVGGFLAGSAWGRGSARLEARRGRKTISR